MNLEQFQASKTWTDDPGAALHDCAWHGEPPGKGWVYLGALYIEQVQAHWPPQARAAGQWHLLIGRADWISDGLPSLEARLYDFAVSEGYTEPTDSSSRR